MIKLKDQAIIKKQTFALYLNAKGYDAFRITSYIELLFNEFTHEEIMKILFIEEDKKLVEAFTEQMVALGLFDCNNTFYNDRFMEWIIKPECLLDFYLDGSNGSKEDIVLYAEGIVGDEFPF